MSIPRKIAYNVVISSIAKVLSTASALVGIGFLTRYLGQDGFGMYATALAFLALFSALGDWGIYQTATREISRPNSNEKEIMSNAFGLRIIISLLIVFSTPIIVIALPYQTQLKLAIILVSFSFVFSSFYQLLIGMFQKRIMMDRVTISELIGKIIQVSLIITGVKMNWSFYFIILTLLANMAFNFTAVFLLSRKFIKFKPSFNVLYWKKFLKQSAPLGLSALVTFIYFKADTILLSLLKPQEDVGIYSAAYKVIENITFFPAMIVGLTMPIFSFHIFNDQKKFISIVNKNFKIFVILVIPLIIGTCFLADEIIGLIAGPQFGQSATVLRIIIFALGFIFFGQLFNNILIAARLQKNLLIVLAICAIFNITSNLILIPKYSYFSTSYVSVATELLVVILTGSVILSKLKFLPRTDRIIPMLVSGVIMAMFLWYFQNINFFLRAAASVIIYSFCLLIFQVISKEEIKSLISKKPEIKNKC